MNCLDNLIGIRGTDCDGNPIKDSVANLYVNDLPGISVGKAEKTADGETIDGITTIERMIELSQSELINDVTNLSGSKYDGRSRIENRVAGVYRDTDTPITVGAKYRGVKFQIRTNEFLSVTINTLTFYGNTTASGVEFMLYDLTSGEKLQTWTADVVQGKKVSIAINHEILTRNDRMYYAVVYDATAVSGYGNDLLYTSSCYGCHDWFRCGGSIYVNTIEVDKTDSVTNANSRVAQNAGGLSIEFSTQCSAESYVCANARSFSFALWYKTAVNLYQIHAVSDRNNAWVQLYSEQAEKLIETYSKKYEDSLNTLLQQMERSSSICFSCRSRVQSTVRIP